MGEVQQLRQQLESTKQRLAQAEQREAVLKQDLSMIREQTQAKPNYAQSVEDLTRLLQVAEAENRNLQMRVKGLEAGEAMAKEGGIESRRSSASVASAERAGAAKALPRAQSTQKTTSFQEAVVQRSASNSRRGSQQSTEGSPTQPKRSTPAAQSTPPPPAESAVARGFDPRMPSMGDVLGTSTNMDIDANSVLKIDGVIVQARNLPKVDRFGSIDGYVEIFFGHSDHHKTDYVKDSFNPVWNHTLPQLKGTVDDHLEIRLWDWNRVSADKCIGHAKVDAKELMDMRAPTEKWVALHGMKGAITGKDGAAKVLLRIQCTIEQPAGAASAVSRGGASGAATGASPMAPNGSPLSSVMGRPTVVPKEELKEVAGSLEVTVTQLSHLPKMDGMFGGGKCDPFVIMEIGQEKVQTSVKKNTFSASWSDEDPLFLDVPPIKNPDQDLRLKLYVYDWDRMGKNEIVGETEISLTSLVHPTDSSSTKMEGLGLKQNGQEVKGHDKQATTLSVSASWLPAHPITRPRKGISSARSETRYVQFEIHRCASLPKTDTFGKCDPYVQIQCGERTYRTSTKTMTFDPQWGLAGERKERFLLEIPENIDILHVAVWDWDRANADDMVGSVDIHVDALLEYTQAPEEHAAGFGAEEGRAAQVITLDLRDQENKRLRGHSKKFAQVYVSSSTYTWSVPERLPDCMRDDINVLRTALRQKEYRMRVKITKVDSPPGEELRPLKSSCFIEIGIQNDSGQVLGETVKSGSSDGSDPHMFNDELNLKVERTSRKIDELVFFAKLIDAGNLLAPAGAIVGLGSQAETRGVIFVKLSELLGACQRSMAGNAYSFHGELPLRKFREGPLQLTAHGYPCMMEVDFTLELPKQLDTQMRSMVEESHLESENILKQLEELDQKTEKMVERQRHSLQFSAEKSMRLSDLSSQLNQIKAQHKPLEPAKPQAWLEEKDTSAQVEELEKKIEGNLNELWLGGMMGDQKEILVGIAVTLVHVLFFRVFIG